MRHIVDAIAAQGRNDDTELLHVTKGELAGLDALARKHFGRELPRNPRTGIKEASLFRDMLGNEAGTALDIAAPVAVGFIPGVGIPAAVAMGAGIGAANQGLGKNATTEGTLMGAVAGGMGAYGGANLASGMSEAGAAQIGEKAATDATQQAAQSSAQDIAGGQVTGETYANIKPDQFTNMQAGFQANNVPIAEQQSTLANVNTEMARNNAIQNASTYDKLSAGKDFLTTKEAISPALTTATSGAMVAGIPAATATTTSTGTPVNKTLPKSEVYYTPYGERRTRLVAAQGGLMTLSDGEFGDYDSADEENNPRRYAGGGIAGTGWGEQNRGGFSGLAESMQPGGAFGDLHGQVYGALKGDEWNPGGAMGSLIPGANQYHAKKRQEEEQKAQAAQAQAAAAQKAEQEQQTKDYWKQRYATPTDQAQAQDQGIATMAMGGMTPSPERAGLANLGFSGGRYLQGPGDGMSDSIKSNIDGKQEARLATGEFVVPADVVSGLGNGDSNSGAKQLHGMMDRVRMSRTGTKKQGKQINPRKSMPV